MAPSRSKEKKGYEMLVCGVNCKAPYFKLSLAIVKVLDPASTLKFHPKVLLVHDLFFLPLLYLGTQNPRDEWSIQQIMCGWYIETWTSIFGNQGLDAYAKRLSCQMD